MISEKELNSYRLTSMEEPTDEMLAQIMHEAADLYRKENEDASKRVIDMIKEASNEAITQYQTRYGRQHASTRHSRSTTKTKRIMISEKELNSYRLTSMEEPTDEMLAQIMHEAAEIYNRENQEAHDKLFANMQKMAKEQRQNFNLN